MLSSRLVWWTIAGGVAAIGLFCAAGAGAAPLRDDSAALAEVMLTRLNEVRHDAGLPPLRTNPILTQIAFTHAQEIAAHHHYAHTGLDGRGPKQRALDAGYGAGRQNVKVTENFVGRPELNPAFEWLMGDPPHRANMLSADYREVGVGAARMSYGYVWVIDFGTYAGIDAVLNAPPTPVPTPTPVPPTDTPTPIPIPTDTPTATPPPTDTPTATAGATNPPAPATGAAGPGTASAPAASPGDGSATARAPADSTPGVDTPSVLAPLAGRAGWFWLVLLLVGVGAGLWWYRQRAGRR
jgi:hypothetical protein